MTDETQAVLDRVRAAKPTERRFLPLAAEPELWTMVRDDDLRTLLATVDALREDARLDIQFCEFTGRPPFGGTWHDYFTSCIAGRTVRLRGLSIAARPLTETTDDQ